MEEVEILPFSVFGGPEYVRHEGIERRGSRCVRYQTYLISENYFLPDAIAFAYEDSIQAAYRADKMSMRKVGGSGEVDVDVKSSEKESSEDSDENNSEPLSFNAETGSISEEV